MSTGLWWVMHARGGGRVGKTIEQSFYSVVTKQTWRWVPATGPHDASFLQSRRRCPEPCSRSRSPSGEIWGATIRAVATGGASDANTIAELGVPVLDGLGPVSGGMHSADERLVVGSIPERVALLRGIEGLTHGPGAVSITMLTVNMDSSSDPRRAPRTQMTDFGSGA